MVFQTLNYTYAELCLYSKIQDELIAKLWICTLVCNHNLDALKAIQRAADFSSLWFNSIHLDNAYGKIQDTLWAYM